MTAAPPKEPIVDGEFSEEKALAVRDESLIATFNPKGVIARATEQADALKDIIEQKKLYALIQGRKHVTVEGWQTLGALNGLQAFTESVTVAKDGEEVTATALVSARRVRDGIAIAQAEGFCSTKENRWKGRDEYAVRSMAQTRATSKVFRQALAWVMVLAGYEPTPEAEAASTGPAVSPEDRAAIDLARQGSDAKAEDAIKKFMKDRGFKSWADFYHRATPEAVEIVREILGVQFEVKG